MGKEYRAGEEAGFTHRIIQKLTTAEKKKEST